MSLREHVQAKLRINTNRGRGFSEKNIIRYELIFELLKIYELEIRTFFQMVCTIRTEEFFLVFSLILLILKSRARRARDLFLVFTVFFLTKMSFCVLFLELVRKA